MPSPLALRLYVPVYTATLLLSAFLLFGVQPLFGKMVLPMLGGSPAVWNTAMVFFQAMLLAGYAYAHATSRLLPPRIQAALHIVLLLVFTLALPLAIPAGWSEPPATSDPGYWQIAMMTVAVGGPFFVLAATAPMLQRWFAATGHPEAQNPYFLYSASNLGSMMALLLYPLVFEPLMTVGQQSAGWGGGYILLIALTLACGLLTSNRRVDEAAQKPANDNPLTPRLIGLWLLLSFAPSSLMLGVTTTITTDLGSAPLLWIVPLILYVGTFIIAFARVRVIKTGTIMLLQGIVMAAAVGFFTVTNAVYTLLFIPLHLLLFFVTALACHMQLAQLRPGARHLTAFYLIMAAGGVLGGIFNALLAPRLFHMPAEYPIVLGLAGFLRYLTVPAPSWEAATDKFRKMMRADKGSVFAVMAAAPVCAILAGIAPMLHRMPAGFSLMPAYAIFACLAMIFWRRRAFALTAAALLALHPGFSRGTSAEHIVLTHRNFFGIERVMETKYTRNLLHGTTVHGTQAQNPEYKMTPLSYYGERGPAGDIFSLLDARPQPQRVAALGLGVGSISCYAWPGRDFDFYEIDPDVAAIAENKAYFTYLSDCGSPYKIIFGDARLKIAKAPDHSYDLIFLDVFSSDNIPVHVMTREAFDIYRRKLKPGGMIAINISNRYLKLRPEVAAIARDLGMDSMFRMSHSKLIGRTGLFYDPAFYGVLAENPETLNPLLGRGWRRVDLPDSKRAWTDDYSNLVGALNISFPRFHFQKGDEATEKN